MATRSNIAYMCPVYKTVKTIYCHWDGSPDTMLPILTNHYNDTDKVMELLELGDMSSIGPTIDSCVVLENAFQDGEMFNQYNSLQDFFKFVREGVSYVYLFDRGIWNVLIGENTEALTEADKKAIDAY